MFASLIAPSLTSAYVLADRAKDALEMLERAGRQAASIGIRWSAGPAPAL